MVEQSTLATEDGTNLNVYWQEAAGTPKAFVHINHGLAEHAARYARFMEALSVAGYASVAQDHRGHGNTTGSDAPLGSFSRKEGWSKMIIDAIRVGDEAGQRFDGLPKVVFGHSMGSAVALDVVLSNPTSVSAAAFWNGARSGLLPTLLANILKIERALKGSDVSSTWAPTLSFEAWNKAFAPNRTDFDWLSRDEAEVDKYVSDPKCGFPASIGMWIDLLQGLAGTARLERYAELDRQLPIHILNGDQDPCSDKGAAAKQLENRFSQLGHSNITSVILKGARHETLNEIDRDTSTAQFIDWLDWQFAK